jgi:hypothetical protein
MLAGVADADTLALAVHGPLWIAASAGHESWVSSPKPSPSASLSNRAATAIRRLFAVMIDPATGPTG